MGLSDRHRFERRPGRAYQSQLDLRRKAGLLADFGNVMVVADPDGKRIGSGGSTIYCLLQVLRRELQHSTLIGRRLVGRRGHFAPLKDFDYPRRRRFQASACLRTMR